MKYTLAIVALFAACSSPMKMKADDLRTLEKEEGRVFGSIAVTAEAPDKNESSWAWMHGGKSGDHDYGFEITKQKTAFIDMGIGAKSYKVSVTPGKDEAFALKMPAGNYAFSQMTQSGFSNLTVDLGPRFTVVAGQNTYIGRMTVALPARLTVGTPALISVGDAQETDMAALGTEYREVLANPVKGLMLPK